MPIVAPATIHLVKERRTKRRQARPGSMSVTGRLGREMGKASNIDNRLKGIALANAKAILPKTTVELRSLLERAREIDPIQPAMLAMENANRRFTGALGSRLNTKMPRPRSTAQRTKTLTD